MNLGKFGVLLEGYLREDEDGFYIENEGGRKFRLDEVLSNKKGQEVRFTIATFNDLDELTKKVRENMRKQFEDKNEDDNSGKQDNQLSFPFEESS